MNDLPGMDDIDLGLAPSVNGILQCLKFLAAEAASLKLLRTLSAIEDALDMAACESGATALDEKLEEQAAPVFH